MVAWKEVVDLARDRRTLAATVLLPMAGLPLLALLTGVLSGLETVRVVVYYEEAEAYSVAEWLAGTVAGILESWGLQASVAAAEGPPQSLAGVDVAVILPRGFSENYTSLDRQAVVLVSVLVGSPASDAARSAVQAAVSGLSDWLASRRVEELASIAGLALDPRAVLEPVRLETAYHRPTGAPAPPEAVEVAETARLLEFALFFAANPAVIYMSDVIVGERERRTIEALLVAPVSRRDLLAGKIAAATVLGLVAAAADTVGVLVYFAMLEAVGIRLSPGLAAVHAGVTVLLVVMTSAIVAPIAARSGSVRAAQASSFLVLMAAMAVYFTAFTVDLLKLPAEARAVLYLVPFTHAALVVHNYILGNLAAAAAHALIMAAVTAAMIPLAARAFASEKLVTLRP